MNANASPPRQPMAVAFSIVVLGLLLGLAGPPAAGQTTLLSEGFEGVFPAENGWGVGDSNPAGNTAYWKDVNAAFGGEGTHSGSWKGYCAGVGYLNTVEVPWYPDDMQAYMSKNLDLSTYASATLSFWYKIPSLENTYDKLRVWMDSTIVWERAVPQTAWSQVTTNLNAYVGGTHTLKFEFYSDSSNNGEGAYLDDILVEGTLCATDAYEPDNSSAATKFITAGETQSRAICPVGDEDWVSFTLSGHQTVVITTGPLGGYPGGDTVLDLYGPDASPRRIAWSDDYGGGMWSQIATNLGPGVYYVLVREYGADGVIGGYTLSLQSLPIPKPTLAIARAAGNTLEAFWPQPEAGWILQYASTLSDPAAWTDLPPPYPTNAGAFYYVESAPAGRKFYRLRQATPAGAALIPAGSFVMGNCMDPGEGESSELPLHTIFISGFLMDRTEVSRELWLDVYNWALIHGYTFDNPGSFKGLTHPVQTVNWYDAVKWCNARSEKEGLVPCYYTNAAQLAVYRAGRLDLAADCVKWSSGGYRLPTEAEWEKAARGGVRGHRFPWSHTDEIVHSQANYYSGATYAYDTSPTRGYHPTFATGNSPYTSPVGYFAANGYGLFDMAGNAYEWCWDWYGDWYSDPGATQSDTRGPASGSTHVLRGGNWFSWGRMARCADRNAQGVPIADDHVGFRCVRGP